MASGLEGCHVADATGYESPEGGSKCDRPGRRGEHGDSSDTIHDQNVREESVFAMGYIMGDAAMQSQAQIDAAGSEPSLRPPRGLGVLLFHSGRG